jgi:ATP-binding cassette subfamily C (CFTR/MRP) protein 2
MAMLFRLVDPFAQGRILIDGVDTMRVPLHTLRSRIALIPQDATMFSGTLRFNMDPWEVASDAQLWEMLERVELLEFVRSLPHGLETVVANNGANFSVGQRQLISIGRALVRGAKVLL